MGQIFSQYSANVGAGASLMTGVSISYGDVAPEAKEKFNPTSDFAEFDTLHQLQQYNLNFPNFANPCEKYSVALDGTASAFPSMPKNENIGLWSEQISNDDGTFTEPIVLTLRSEGQYSSQGISLTFDTYNGIYATRVGIKWLRITDESITTLAEQEFTPDNAFYFCQKKVENYNKLVITFYALNMPKNRLKLRVIDYGYGTVFYGDELRSVKLIQEIDPISTQISINTADFTLDSKSDIEYSFKQKQSLSIFFNGELKATTFVKKSNRKAKRLWSIQTEDYIGLMDGIPYVGGIYNGENAYDVLVDIFTAAKVPYSINEALKDFPLYGHIPFTTCREALMQVCFAVQNVADTSCRSDVGVFALDNEIKQTVPLNRIMQGQNFTDDEIVTGVEVVYHTFDMNEEDPETITAYNAKEDGIGQNVFVQFSEPLWGLQTRGDGEIVESGANYAIINANASTFRLGGNKYEHTTATKRMNRDDVGAGTIEKVVSVMNATLVSSHNIDNVLEKCYNWLTKTMSTNLKIVEGKHVEYGHTVKWGERKWGTFKYGEKTPPIVTYDQPVNVGDRIQAETEYLGVVDGVAVKQSFNLNGNIIVKDTVLK